MSLRISQLLGFNAAKPAGVAGGYWSYGFGVRTLNIAGGGNVNVVDEAFNVYGADVYTVPYSYIVTISADLQLMNWEDPGIGNHFAPGCVFTLVNQAIILGIGGTGGAGGYSAGAGGNGGNGSIGGTALYLNGKTVSIDNGAGYIFGGGGGGGGGAGASASATSNQSLGPDAFDCTEFAFNSTLDGAGGGGGGGGRGVGSGGSRVRDKATLIAGILRATQQDAAGTVTFGGRKQVVTVCDTDDLGMSATITTLSVNGTPGDFIPPYPAGAGGVGGTLSGFSKMNNTAAQGATGGAGGDWGAAGSNGVADASASGNLSAVTGAAGIGGAAGKAITLDGGTVVWLAGNDPSRVKGAVS